MPSHKSSLGRVGVVVVTHNSEHEIRQCLESLTRQTRQPDRIILADSGSTDRTRRVADDACAYLGLTIECLPFDRNVGFAVANNRAVAELRDCEHVALLNPDAFPEPGWLAALLTAAERHPEAASFASRLMMAGADDIVDGLGDVFHTTGLAWRRGHGHPLRTLPSASQSGPVFAACAAAALYRRSDWERVGGFDERFFCYAEDVDLGFRLQLLGRSCLYVHDAVALHVGSATTGVHSAFSVYYGYRNLEWVFLKNMPAVLFWRHLPGHLLANAVQILWFGCRGRWGSVLAAKRDALRQIAAVLRDRRAIQATRTVNSAVIARALDRTSVWARFAAIRSRARVTSARPTS